MHDFLKNNIDRLANAALAELDSEIYSFMDDACLDPIDIEQYSVEEKTAFIEWAKSMQNRWNALPAKFKNDRDNATMLPLLLQDIDKAGDYDMLEYGDEAIIWKLDVMDLIASGYSPMNADDFEAVIEKIPSKNDYIRLGDFMKAYNEYMPGKAVISERKASRGRIR